MIYRLYITDIIADKMKFNGESYVGVSSTGQSDGSGEN